ncbi:MAG: hypothetical protein HY698_08590 [Deltaproteobacteria bacterium]|nr:hypothetical protein [Deltaproteobacteria bacterium]
MDVSVPATARQACSGFEVPTRPQEQAFFRNRWYRLWWTGYPHKLLLSVDGEDEVQCSCPTVLRETDYEVPANLVVVGDNLHAFFGWGKDTVHALLDEHGRISSGPTALPEPSKIVVPGPFTGELSAWIGDRQYVFDEKGRILRWKEIPEASQALSVGNQVVVVDRYGLLNYLDPNLKPTAKNHQLGTDSPTDYRAPIYPQLARHGEDDFYVTWMGLSEEGIVQVNLAIMDLDGGFRMASRSFVKGTYPRIVSLEDRTAFLVFEDASDDFDEFRICDNPLKAVRFSADGTISGPILIGGAFDHSWYQLVRTDTGAAVMSTGHMWANYSEQNYQEGACVRAISVDISNLPTVTTTWAAPRAFGDCIDKPAESP